MLSNNSEVSASGLELEECPAISKVNIWQEHQLNLIIIIRVEYLKYLSIDIF
jgi:hypothetical protein